MKMPKLVFSFEILTNSASITIKLTTVQQQLTNLIIDVSLLKLRWVILCCDPVVNFLHKTLHYSNKDNRQSNQG